MDIIMRMRKKAQDSFFFFLLGFFLKYKMHRYSHVRSFLQYSIKLPIR